MGRLYLSQSLVLRFSLVILVPLPVFVTFKPKETAMAEITEISEVKIERNPPESKLTELGVTSWSTYASFTLFASDPHLHARFIASLMFFSFARLAIL